MRIVVLGGGVVGVTTAYQLQRDGHEVVLLERNPEVASGASWGNAGMIAPGHSFVWSSPRAPIILAKSLMLKDQALRFRLSADPRLYAWTWGFLKECTAAKARRNTLLKHRLAAYSQKVLDEVVADEAIDYDRNTRGILYMHRSQKALDSGVEHMKLLESDGQAIKVLTRDQVIALEPGLAHAGEKIAGAILCPTDETGDCAKFTRALAARIVERGGAIVTGATVQGLTTDGDKVTQALTDRGPFAGDAYVLALGAESPILARKLGLRLPIYPIKGYSLTIPIGAAKSPPTIACLDEHNLVAISRFRDRLRITATAEFAGYDASHEAVRLRLHEAGDAGALSRRRRVRPGGNVGGPSADDADQSAARRPAPIQEPRPQLRPRPHWVDHVARLGAHCGRPHRRPRAGNSPGRPHGRLKEARPAHVSRPCPPGPNDH